MDRAWFASKPVGLASKQQTSVLSRTAALLFDIAWVHMSKIRLPRIRLLLNVYIQVLLILRYRGQFEQHIMQVHDVNLFWMLATLLFTVGTEHSSFLATILRLESSRIESKTCISLWVG